MILEIFTVYDSKAEMYLRPFHFKSSAEAIRSFGDLCNDPESMPGKHPADFTLFHIGYFDDQSSQITSDVHISLGTGNEFRKAT